MKGWQTAQVVPPARTPASIADHHLCKDFKVLPLPPEFEICGKVFPIALLKQDGLLVKYSSNWSSNGVVINCNKHQ